MSLHLHATQQASILFALGHRLSWQDAETYAWQLRTLNNLARLETNSSLYPAAWEIDWNYSQNLLPDLCWYCGTKYGQTVSGRLRYGCPSCGYHTLQGSRSLIALAGALSWPPELMEQLYLQWLAANPAYQQSTGQSPKV